MPLRLADRRLRTRDTRAITPAPKKVEPFYVSTAWLALIAQIKRERGDKCEDPTHDPRRPRTGVRIFGDHIKERKDGGEPLDKANVMLRCGSCHGRKTAIERARRASKQYHPVT
jgi:5-methylcytosine-specific restriction enzyme A